MQKYTTIDEFLMALDANKREQVDALRDIIMSAEPKLAEHIKWNAPSYMLEGEDRLTFNLMNKQSVVKLVFHMGATRKEDKKGTPIMQDTSGLLEWSSDIRAMITFLTMDDVTSREQALRKIIKDWLAIPSAI